MPKKKANCCLCGHGEMCEFCTTLKPEKKMKRKIYKHTASPLADLMDAAKDDPYFFLAPELREAKMLEESDPEKSRKIRDAYCEKFLKEKADRKADEKEKKNRTGKYDPINIPLCKCRVCGDGNVVQRLKWSHSCNPRIGGPPDSFRVHDCYFCNLCGITYAFVPSEKK